MDDATGGGALPGEAGRLPRQRAERRPGRRGARLPAPTRPRPSGWSRSDIGDLRVADRETAGRDRRASSSRRRVDGVADRGLLARGAPRRRRAPAGDHRRARARPDARQRRARGVRRTRRSPRPPRAWPPRRLLRRHARGLHLRGRAAAGLAGDGATRRPRPTTTRSWTPSTGEVVRRSEPRQVRGPALLFDNYPGAPDGRRRGAQVDLTPYLDPGADRADRAERPRVRGPGGRGARGRTSTIRSLTRPRARRRRRASGHRLRLPVRRATPTARLRLPARRSAAAGTRRPPLELEQRQRPGGHPALLVREPLPRPPGGRAGDRIRPASRATSRRAGPGAENVIAQAQDGADTTRPASPDPDHSNNANMLVLPATASPGAHADVPLGSRSRDLGPDEPPNYRPVHGGDDPSLVFHEYTHGLTNRLVTDAQGYGALNGAQAGAIDEGTADWYALDYLVGRRQPVPPGRRATPGRDDGELRGGGPDRPAHARPSTARSARTTRPARAPAAAPGAGGYTYGDFAKIRGGAEAHDDGEIWAQTLWELRRRLHPRPRASDGLTRARRLVTDGLRLVPPNPSFLDMRNAILLADEQAGQRRRPPAIIWERVRAARHGLRRVHASTPTTCTRSRTSRSAARAATPVGQHERARCATWTPARRSPARSWRSRATTAAWARTSPHAPRPTAPTASTACPPAHGSFVTVAPADGLRPRRWPTTSRSPPARVHGAQRRAAAQLGARLGRRRGQVVHRAELRELRVRPAARRSTAPGAASGAPALAAASSAMPGAKELVIALPAGDHASGEVRIDPSSGCGDPAAAALAGYEVQVSANGVAPTPPSPRARSRAAQRGQGQRVALSSQPGRGAVREAAGAEHPGQLAVHGRGRDPGVRDRCRRVAAAAAAAAATPAAARS